MSENPLILLGLTTIISAIPIAVWLYIFSQSESKAKKTLLLIFGLGCFTAPLLLGIQVLWEKYPQFNLLNFIETGLKTPVLATIAVILLFVIMEETIKLYVVKTIDSKTLLIKKINDAMRYGITIALGFSFGENIYYLYSYWGFISSGELLGMYIFRSIFTTSAHILYTGVAGYFYGIGKFSMVLNKQKELIGEKDFASKVISKIFNLPLSEGFRQKTVMKGYLFAIAMHFAINYMLELNQILPVVAINIFGYFFLQYLLKRKSGHLILLNDPTTKRQSTIASKDEDVVIELMGMWFKEKRYVDVLHICERLLERDPDNNMVKLFKAKAIDSMDKKDIYRKILGTVIKTKEDLSEKQKNIITTYTEEKENLLKIQQKIKKQLEKEGKKFQQPTISAPSTPQEKDKKEEETFKL